MKRPNKGNDTSNEQNAKKTHVDVGVKKSHQSPKGNEFQEEFIEFLYRPHTLTGLLVVIAVIIYLAFMRSDVVSTVSNVKTGIFAAILIFLMFCMMNFRDGVMVRPHPAFWRVVQGVSIVYLTFLVFLLFQNVSDARQYFTYLYPELGKPLPERSYAGDCRIYTPESPTSNFQNIKDTVFDEFILAHVLGYFAKALLLRDYKLCWVLSVFFELIEVSLQHWLENFKECWWDHLIVDVFVCNALGIYIGIKTSQYFEFKQYHWVGLSKMKTAKDKIVRTMQQFTPIKWTHYDWEMFSNPKRFLYVFIIVMALSIVDTCAFFLKFILWIPPRNPLNTYRLLLWWFLGMPAIHEFYNFIDDPKCKRMGANAWIAVAVIVTEVLICIKFGSGMFFTPTPHYVYYPWLASLALWALWLVLYFGVFRNTKNTFVVYALRVLAALSFVPVTFTLVAGAPDLQWGQQWFNNLVETYIL